jgi:hypothetical protein
MMDLRENRLLLFALICVLCFVTRGEAQFKKYTGTGDDVLMIEKPKAGLPALLVVSGNSVSKNFSMISYSSNREYIDLLVNTTDAYSGIVPIDLPPSTETKMLKVTATGSWQISVYSIGAAQKISVEAPKTDSGDNVLWIEGKASIADISGNSEGSNFSVIAYDGNGNYADLLVNTTDPYSGRVLLPANTLLLKISATGNWSIKLK